MDRKQPTHSVAGAMRYLQCFSDEPGLRVSCLRKPPYSDVLCWLECVSTDPHACHRHALCWPERCCLGVSWTATTPGPHELCGIVQPSRPALDSPLQGHLAAMYSCSRHGMYGEMGPGKLALAIDDPWAANS